MWGRVQAGDGFNCLCAIEKGKLIRSTCLIHVFFIAKGRGERHCVSQYQMTESIPEYTNEEEEGEGQWIPDKQY